MKLQQLLTLNNVYFDIDFTIMHKVRGADPEDPTSWVLTELGIALQRLNATINICTLGGNIEHVINAGFKVANVVALPELMANGWLDMDEYKKQLPTGYTLVDNEEQSCPTIHPDTVEV